MSVTRRARKKPCQTVKTMCKSASITHCFTKKIRMWQGKKDKRICNVLCNTILYVVFAVNNPSKYMTNFHCHILLPSILWRKMSFCCTETSIHYSIQPVCSAEPKKIWKKERKWFLFCWWKEEITVYLQLKNHTNENLLMWFHHNFPYWNGAQHSIYCAIGRIYVKCGNSWKTWFSEIFRL